MHEISHAIMFEEMIKLVNDFASRNEGFSQAKRELETRYGKNLTSEEVFTDVCGQLFGNQEFINSLETQNTVESRTLIKQIYELIKKLLNRFTQEGRYRNFISNLEGMWRQAYANTTMEQSVENLKNNSENDTFYSKSIDNFDNVDYNKLSHEVIPYISADERKIKFLEYGQAESFYELDYETMAKAIAIGSKYAIEAQNKGLSNSYFTDNNYMYYFDVLDTSNNAFGITEVVGLENVNEEAYNEEYKNGNSKIFDGQSNRRKELDNSNINAIKNRATSNDDVELVGGKQEQQGINKGRQDTKESVGNLSRELENSSFSIEEKIDEAVNNIEQRNSRDNGLNEEFEDIAENVYADEMKAINNIDTLDDMIDYFNDRFGLIEQDHELNQLKERYEEISDKISQNKANTFKEKVEKGTKNIVNYILESYPKLNVKIENSNKSNSFYVKFYSGENIVGELRVSDHVRPPKRTSSGWEQHIYDAQYVPNVNAQDNVGRPVFYNETNAKNELFEAIKDNLKEMSEDTEYLQKVDNMDPTTDEDIRYSQENPTWKEHLKENYKATGTRTDMSKTKLKKDEVLKPKVDNKKKKIISNKTFAEQVDDVINGIYNKQDMLVVSEETPRILQEIGLENHPITLTQKHLNTIMAKEGKYKSANSRD